MRKKFINIIYNNVINEDEFYLSIHIHRITLEETLIHSYMISKNYFIYLLINFNKYKYTHANYVVFNK